MITQIRIKDFQSIEQIDIECGPITVIHGESDTGKSAIVRALYGLAFNSYPSGHVRDGAKQSYVSVVVDDEWVVAAEKGNGANSYRLTGSSTEADRRLGLDVFQEEWDKVGTEVPVDVSALLGWKALELDDGSRFTPNFHLQFDPPFLLTDSPSRRAKVLGALTNVATLYAAIREASAWERRSKTRADAQQQIIDQVSGEIPEIEAQLAELRVESDKLAGLVARGRSHEVQAKQLTGIMVRLVQERETVELCQQLIEMYDVDAEDLLTEAERMIGEHRALSEVRSRVDQAQRDATQAAADFDRVTAELVDAETMIDNFTAEYPRCPMCGSDECWREMAHAE